MFTVTVGLLASGNSNTRRPLARRYSQMPSTQGPATTALGNATSPAAFAAGINASESATARAQDDDFSIISPERQYIHRNRRQLPTSGQGSNLPGFGLLHNCQI